MHCELWDATTGNCIGRYATEHEAATSVKSLVRRFGAAHAHDLELTSEDDLGAFHGTRSGSDLLAWAEAELAEQPAISTAGLATDRAHAGATGSN